MNRREFHDLRRRLVNVLTEGSSTVATLFPSMLPEWRAQVLAKLVEDVAAAAFALDGGQPDEWGPDDRVCLTRAAVEGN